MKIETDKKNATTVLRLEGALSFPDGTALLRDRCRELIAGGDTRFVFDLRDVPWIDSSGLGEVVSCYKRARERGGVVKLVLQDLPHQQFTYCHLDKMFEIYDDPQAAIASFAA